VPVKSADYNVSIEDIAQTI